MHRSLLGPLLLLTAIPARGQSTEPLQPRVARRLTQHEVPGVTWALVYPDRVETGAAGLRDVVRRVPMRATDRVQVGSVAKTFTAVAVLRLVTLGRVALEDPILTHLPMLPLENPWEGDAPVRVRHLLDHTSGLGDAHLWQVFSARSRPDDPLDRQLVRPGQSLRIQVRPGTRFSYSNTGFLVLGLLIERVTGERYETWVDRELLAPLGMHRSTLTWVSQVGPAADTTMAMGHFDAATPQASYGIPVRPATQFATTAADMATWMRFLMGPGVVDGRQLVDSVLLRAMGRASTTDAAAAGLPGGYGLGLVQRERWGITGRCHLGNIGTFRAIMCLYPDHQRAFFASYNSDPESLPWDDVDSLFASQLGIPQPPEVAAGTPDVDLEAWRGWYLPMPVRFEQFAYLDRLGSVIRVRAGGASLSLTPLGGTSRWLDAVGGAQLRLRGRRGPTHLVLTSHGTRVITDGQRTLERIPTPVLVLTWFGAAVGAVSILVLLIVGVGRTAAAVRGRRAGTEPLRWVTAALGLLVLTPLLYLTQPFLAIGDPTAANVAVAVATALVPVGVLASLGSWWRTRALRATAWRRLDGALLLGSLQWLVTLAWWKLLPLALWR